jgi:hypothetical protein
MSTFAHPVLKPSVLPDDVVAVVSTDVESSFDVEEELLLQDANANMLAVKRHAINFIMINFVLIEGKIMTLIVMMLEK